MIKDMKTRPFQHRTKVFGLATRTHRGEHVRLRPIRDPFEQILVAHDCKRPGLLVDCARRMNGGIDEAADRRPNIEF
jgi:hypothetical protein